MLSFSVNNATLVIPVATIVTVFAPASILLMHTVAPTIVALPTVNVIAPEVGLHVTSLLIPFQLASAVTACVAPVK